MDKQENIKELASYMTVGIFFSYILGYLVVTGFLTSYKIFNDDLLNINFLKTGIVFLLVLVPLLIIIVSKTYNYKELLSKIILYIVAISLLFITWNPYLFLILIPYLLLCHFSIKYKNNYKKILWFLTTIGIIGPVILAVYFKFLWDLYLIILLTSVFSLMMLYWFKIQKFGLGYFIAHLFWTCIIAYYFGFQIYGHLPDSFKGGYSGTTYIICKEKSKPYLKNIGFNFDSTTFMDNVKILYSSNDKLLISKNDTTYFLSKNLFNGFKSSR